MPRRLKKNWSATSRLWFLYNNGKACSAEWVDFRAKGIRALAAKRCPYCGDSLTVDNISPDHIFPRHLGGSSGLHNIEFICYDCNMEKSYLPLDVYIESKPETRIGNRKKGAWLKGLMKQVV
jgi:5-methylcytosine-specific restriction endonuclease McrA